MFIQKHSARERRSPNLIFSFVIFQGTYGLGIMIIEGKHSEVGQGIFVSDIQVGSAAEQVRTTCSYAYYVVLQR